MAQLPDNEKKSNSNCIQLKTKAMNENAKNSMRFVKTDNEQGKEANTDLNIKDKRRKVKEERFSHIVKLTAEIGGIYYKGTATIIRSKASSNKAYALTCAHNIMKIDNTSDKITAASYVWITGQNVTLSVSEFDWYPKYEDRKKGNDIAVIAFEWTKEQRKKILNINGNWNVRLMCYYEHIPNVWKPNKEAIILGFPAEVNDKQCNALYGMKGKVNHANAKKNKMSYDIQTSGGQSGSIITACNGVKENKWKVVCVGIHTHGDSFNSQGNNDGVMLNRNMISWINSITGYEHDGLYNKYKK